MAARKTSRTKPRPRFEYLITTKPKGTECSSCAVWVLGCYVFGTARQLDTTHLNLRGEAMALVLGGRTYEIGMRSGGEPMQRRPWHIAQGLPGYTFIHAEHRCGMNWNQPDYLDERLSFFDDQPDECPF